MAKTRLCKSTELLSSASGIRFFVEFHNQSYPAFAIRHRGKVYAYLNECAHQALELDWNPSEFFDLSGDFIICATHGACYDPADGRCVSGPCVGAHLIAVQVIEQQGEIWLNDDRYQFIEREEI